MTESFETEISEVFWANLTGAGKLNDNNGDFYYKINFIIPNKEAYNKYIAKEKSLLEKEGLSKVKYHSKICDETKTEENDDGEKLYIPTGRKMIRFTSRVTFKNGSTNKINHYDSQGRQIKEEDIPPIGNGSLARIRGSAMAYKVKENIGVTYFVQAIKIIKLVTADDFSNKVDDAVEAGVSAEEAFTLDSF